MNLIDELLSQIERCETIKQHAEEIGPAGRFLVMTLTNDITQARKAIAFTDTVNMIRFLAILREYRE